MTTMTRMITVLLTLALCAALFTGCGGFTQVYDCITEGVDDPMYGGYLDCEGKTAAQLAAALPGGNRRVAQSLFRR